MKCLVFAYSQLGYDCLKALLNATEHTVVAVVTHDDSPNETIWFDSVEQLARDHGIPVLKPLSLKDTDVAASLAALHADILFSFYYRNMIPQAILDLTPLGSYNMHGSLLPKYRGRCPVNWAIINGETETGVTFHEMVRAADAGDIIDQIAVPIEVADTAGQVMKKLCVAAVQSLNRTLPLLVAQTIIKQQQDATRATYFGGRKPADGLIDWQAEAKTICDLVRALQPSPQYPPAYGLICGKLLAVIDCCVLSEPYRTESPCHDKPQKPGDCVQILENHTYVMLCGTAATEYVRVKTMPAGLM